MASGFAFTNIVSDPADIVEDTGFSFLSAGEADVTPEIGFDFGNSTSVTNNADYVSPPFPPPVPMSLSSPAPSQYNAVDNKSVTNEPVAPSTNNYNNIVVEVSKVKKKKSTKKPGWAAAGSGSSSGVSISNADGGGEKEEDEKDVPLSAPLTINHERAFKPIVEDATDVNTNKDTHSITPSVSTSSVARKEELTTNAVSTSHVNISIKKVPSRSTTPATIDTKNDVKVNTKKEGKDKQDNESNILLTSLDEFNERASEITNQLLALKSNRKAILAQRQAEEDLLSSNDNVLVDLERKQAVAIENEDYEKADALVTEIETVKNRIFNGRTSLLSLSKQLNDLKAAKMSLVEEELQLVDRTSVVLNDMQKRSSDDLAMYTKKVSAEEHEANAHIAKLQAR